MKSLFITIISISLISCGEEYQAEEYNLLIRPSLPDYSFDYELPKPTFPEDLDHFNQGKNYAG